MKVRSMTQAALVAVFAFAFGAFAGGQEGILYLRDIGKDFKNGTFIGYGTGGSYPTAWSQFMGHGYWSEDEAWQSDRTYVMPKGRTMRFPATSVAGTYPFPGDTLVVSGTLAMTAYKLPALVTFPHVVFAGKDACLKNWTALENATNPNTASVLQGDITVADGSGLQFTTDDGNLNCRTVLRGKLTTAAGNLVKLYGPKVNSSGVYATEKKHYHHLVLECDVTDCLGDFSANSNTVFVASNVYGSVTVANNGALQPFAPDVALSVGALTLQAKSRLTIPYAESAGAASCGRILVTGAFNCASGVRVSMCVTNAAVAGAFSIGGTFPVLSLATGTLDPDAFVLDDFQCAGFAKTVGVPEASLSVGTDGEGRSTLFVTIEPSVYCVDGAPSGNSGSVTYYCQVTNAAAWSDGLLPHAGAAYQCDLSSYSATSHDYLRFPQAWANCATNFGGDSLTCIGTILVPFGRPLTFNNLTLSDGCYIFRYGSNCELAGCMSINPGAPNGTVSFRLIHATDTTVSAPITGQGLLNIKGGISSSVPYGSVTLAADNSGFLGRIKVSVSDSFVKSGSVAQVPTLDTYFNTLNLSDAKQLGGDLDAFLFNALEIGGMSRVRTATSFTIPAKSNRGLYVNWVGRIYVEPNRTLGVETDITYHGLLRKEGNGVLALGGTPRFGADGTGSPEANSNLFTVVEGAVQPLTATCLDGLAVTFGTKTSLVYDLGTTDGNLRTNGLVFARAESSLAFADAQVPVTLTGVQDDRGSYTIGLVTGSKALCDDLYARCVLARPALGYRVSKRVVAISGDTYRLEATAERRGMTVILR